MAFAPPKCELIHFNKGRKQWKNLVALVYLGGSGNNNDGHSGSSGYSVVKLVESARFLGVWLDRKLSWKAH